jgi:HK97 family phage portal protein
MKKIGPLQKITRWITGEKKSITTGETIPYYLDGKRYRPTFGITNRDAIEKGYTSAAVVYAAIKLIANTAASVPLNAYRPNGDEWEVATGHPLQNLLESPNARLTRRRLYTRIVQHLMLNGNAILTKVRVPENGPPTQLWPINPDIVYPIPDQNEFIRAYEIRVQGKSYMIDAQDVIHLQLENPETPWWGIGPLQAAIVDLEVYKANKLWNLRTVQRGAVTPGVLEVPEDLSIEQFETLRQQLDKRTFGEDDAGRELILGSGMKYHRMALTGEEMGYLESQRFGREEIAMVFGVPPALLTPDNATLANVEAYNQQFWQTTIVPLNTGIADILNLSFAEEYPEELIIQHDYTSIPAMQTNMKQTSEIVVNLARAGFTPQGINRILDLGFEENEITEPTINPQTETQTASRPAPTSKKNINANELEQIWETRNRQRSRWEEEITNRLKGQFEKEKRAVIAKFKATQSESEAIQTITDLQGEMQTILNSAYTAAIEYFAQIEYEYLEGKILKSQKPQSRKNFDPLKLILSFVASEGARKITGIATTTKTQIATIISQGLTPDPTTEFRLTIDEIANQIADTYDTWIFTGPGPDLTIDARAFMIARTELGFAMNYGHQEGARLFGEEYDIELVKVWASSFDERVRGTHRIHSERRPMNGIFSNGLQYPGDPNGPAGEVINCRCTVIHEEA